MDGSAAPKSPTSESNEKLTASDIVGVIAFLVGCGLAVWLFHVAGWVFVAFAILAALAAIYGTTKEKSLRKLAHPPLLAAIGLLPHLIFLVLFSLSSHRAFSGPLASFMEKYEFTVIVAHDRLAFILNPPLLWSILVTMFIISVTVHFVDFSIYGKYAGISRLINGFGLVLVSAMTFTVFSGTSTGVWSPNIDGRIVAALRDDQKADAERGMIGALQWMAAYDPDAIGRLAVKAIEGAKARCAGSFEAECAVQYVRGALPREGRSTGRDRPEAKSVPVRRERYQQMRALEAEAGAKPYDFRAWSKRQAALDVIKKSYAAIIREYMARHRPAFLPENTLFDAIANEMVDAAVDRAVERAVRERRIVATEGGIRILEETPADLDADLQAKMHDVPAHERSFARVDVRSVKFDAVKTRVKAVGRKIPRIRL